MALSFSRPVFAAPTTLFILLALAIAPLVFATPAHADSISIDLDATVVTLQRSGDLYEHTSSLHVHNSNTYGFTLSMNASQPNLVNSKDSSYKIDSVSGTNQKLAANQWGYGMGKNATTFNSVSSASLADITSDNKGSCTSADDCTLYLTLGANIDPKRLPVGSYSTSLTYTATSKPAPAQPSTPSSGGSSSGGTSSGGSSSGGSSYDAWWSICYGRYPSDNDKRSYCYIHNGDMSGYWERICSFTSPFKTSYCRNHSGDMGGYQDALKDACRARYPDGSTDSYCHQNLCVEQDNYERYARDCGSGLGKVEHTIVERHESLDERCRREYPGSDYESRNKRAYCVSHSGNMKDYDYDWKLTCIARYYGESGKVASEKEDYCESHHGDMSGYSPSLSAICDDRYPNDSDASWSCFMNDGNVDWDEVCNARYRDKDDIIHAPERIYCKNHNGDMSGYNGG